MTEKEVGMIGAALIPLIGEKGFDRMVHRFPSFPLLWQCATTGVASAP